MALVINSNDNGGGGYSLSNSDIHVMYPEFDNNILLYLDDRINLGTNLAPTTSAYTVGGTPVHVLSGILCMPNDFNIKGNANYLAPMNNIYFQMNSATASQSLFVRMGLPKPIEAGITIGKTIVLPCCHLVQSATGSQYTDSYVASVQYKVGLLHSDGTISYLCDETITNQGILDGTSFSSPTESNYSTGSQACGLLEYGNRVITTAGATTQAGDYVIVDIIINRGASNGSTLGLEFGFKGATKTKELPKPFQISID